MLKKLAPILSVILSVLLDTAIFPVFYTGRFRLPLSLVIVILCGIQLGRVRGMLYGMVAGLLLDISVGTLGMKVFPYVLIGFLIGFLLDQQPEISRAMERSERLRRLAARVIWIFVLLIVYEITMLIYQYFNTAIFRWSYVGDLLLRTLMLTALCALLAPAFYRMCHGKAARPRKGRNTREVKNF